MVQRRTFLKGGVATVLLAGLIPARLRGSGPYDPAAEGFSHAGFESLLHGWFHVDDGAWKAVELVEVRAEGVWHADYEQFSLHFRGAAREAIAAGTYALAPERGDAFEAYLEPAGDDGSDTFYVACFGVARPRPQVISCGTAA
jgi:hypothetical protein